MSKKIKAALGVMLFAIWGPYLLYVWVMPNAVPDWAMAPGARRALMLSREFEPTFFTLMFAVMFTFIAGLGLYNLVTDQLPE